MRQRKLNKCKHSKWGRGGGGVGACSILCQDKHKIMSNYGCNRLVFINILSH